MFWKIRNLYKNYKSGKIIEEKMAKASYLIMIGIGATLFNKYVQELGFDKAQVLAAQVANYLKGYDINRIILESEEPLKSRIVSIMNEVNECAIKAMDNDFELRAMVIHNLRFQKIFGMQHIDKGYREDFTTSEVDQVDLLLNKYEQGVPFLGVDFDKFVELANNFCQNRVNKK